MTISRVIFLLIIIFAPQAAFSAGSVKDALAAWQKRDVVKTLKIVTPLAKKGDAKAQFMLAQIYKFLSPVKGRTSIGVVMGNDQIKMDNGKGIFIRGKYIKFLKDYNYWYRKAAEQGYPKRKRR